VGPLAAGVLIAVGVIAFYDNPGREPDNPGQTAEQTRPDNRSPVVTEPDDDWDDLGYLAEAHDRIDPARLDRLSANDLELLRKLDADAFLALDRIQQPEDLALVEDLELLRQIDRAEDRE
ncbi:MAG: hypothetical protein KJ044_01860, partial [Planctomycetes bacterium]|nr:hypothetical protein [Planctomycetota bacterium]